MVSGILTGKTELIDSLTLVLVAGDTKLFFGCWGAKLHNMLNIRHLRCCNLIKLTRQPFANSCPFTPLTHIEQHRHPFWSPVSEHVTKVSPIFTQVLDLSSSSLSFTHLKTFELHKTTTPLHTTHFH